MGLNNVKGQNEIVKRFKNVIKEKKMNHSYIFIGDGRTDKEILVKELTKELNCLNKKENEKKCNCINCKRINNCNYPDIITIKSKKDTIKIEEIRELNKKIYTKPYESNYKIVVIRNLEKMNKQAANAFLKILEEPPSYVIYLMLANSLDNILPTIISRCQLVRLNLISKDLVKGYLMEKSNGDIDIDEEQTEEIIKIANNDLDFAFEIMGNIEEIEDYKKVFNLTCKIFDFNSETFNYILELKNAFGFNEKNKKEKERKKKYFKIYFYFLKKILKNLILFKINDQTLIYGVSEKEISSVSEKKLMLILDEVLEFENNYEKYNVNVKLLLNNLILNIKGLM